MNPALSIEDWAELIRSTIQDAGFPAGPSSAQMRRAKYAYEYAQKHGKCKLFLTGSRRGKNNSMLLGYTNDRHSCRPLYCLWIKEDQDNE